jgi:hypothetical protein
MLLFYINSILMFYPKICFRKQVLLYNNIIKFVIDKGIPDRKTGAQNHWPKESSLR